MQAQNPVSAYNSVERATDVEVDGSDDATISYDEEGGKRIGDIYIPPPVSLHCSMESSEPRLIITQIINKNFKSYANTVLGRFHHRFTAIIGSNGSGKSNLIDSLLFVFGFSVNKMESIELSNLLHNSVNHTNTDYCSVAVHFQLISDTNDDICKDIPDNIIVIERVAFRDNSSYYTMNGREVQFKEIVKLLKQHHVDLDQNRFIIRQGEVESMALMKPKGQNENDTGLLEYLEKFIGTSHYKEPLQKIDERIKLLTHARTSKLEIFTKLKLEIINLEQPYNEALNYLRLENESIHTTNLILQKNISEERKNLKKYSDNVKEIHDALMEHDITSIKLQSKREETEKLNRKEIEEFDAANKIKEDLEKDLDGASCDFIRVDCSMAKVYKLRKQNQASLKNCEKELEALKKIYEKNDNELKKCGIKVEKLTIQKAEADNDLQKNYLIFKEQTKPMIEERSQLETEETELDIRNLNTKIAATKAQIEEIHNIKIKSLQTKILNLTNQIMKETNENIPKLQFEVRLSDRKVKETENKKKKFNSMIVKCQDEITELSEQRQKHLDDTVKLAKQLYPTEEALVSARSGDSDLQREIKEIEELEEQEKLKRVKTKQKLTTTKHIINKIKRQISDWKGELKSLKLNKIPGDNEPLPHLHIYLEEELNSHTLQDISIKKASLQTSLNDKKKPNISCIDEYNVKRERTVEYSKELEDITAKLNEMEKLRVDVFRKRYSEFENGFKITNEKFRQIYQKITQGGDAELQLKNINSFTEGISFRVRPPNQTWQNLSNLSCSEKKIVGLALLFALHCYKPSPVYFMDEIDATLDSNNISIITNYIKEKSKKHQFIITSSNQQISDLSDRIISIEKAKN